MFNIGKPLLRLIWAYLEVAQLAIGPSPKKHCSNTPNVFLGGPSLISTNNVPFRNWTKMQTSLQPRSDLWSPLWLGMCCALALVNSCRDWHISDSPIFRATETANIILKQVIFFIHDSIVFLVSSCLWRLIRIAVTLYERELPASQSHLWRWHFSSQKCQLVEVAYHN